MNDNLICDKDCIKDLRPYEKCISLGEQSLTDTELIAAIIKTGVSGKPAGELAKDILDKSHNKGLLGLFDMSIDELMDIKYSVAITACGEEQIYCFTAMIIYRDLSEK